MAGATETLSRPESVRILIELRTLHDPQSPQNKANAVMTDTAPTIVNRTLPRRLQNSAYRVREYLTEKECQVDLRNGRLHINRAKGGIESVHPLHGPELRALRPLQGNSPYVFVSESGTPVTTAWFLRMVQRTGKAAKLPFLVHPHMLRHSTGYKLANDGQDTRSLAHYLGHRNLQSTARYTALAPDRFKGFWKD